jgi:hypothetical protein
MTSPGFGTAPFGTSSFAAPRDIRVSWGRARVRAFATGQPRARTLAARLRAS